METLKTKNMRRHQHHYLVFVQLAVLCGLIAAAFGAQSIQHLVQYFPLVTMFGSMYVLFRLTIAIMHLVDPGFAARRTGHMHGSMLPVLVFEPEN